MFTFISSSKNTFDLLVLILHYNPVIMTLLSSVELLVCFIIDEFCNSITVIFLVYASLKQSVLHEALFKYKKVSRVLWNMIICRFDWMMRCCVWFRLLDLSAALRYENVDMDSCLLEERPKRVVLPDELEAEPTSDPSTRPLSPSAEPSTLTHGSSSVSHTHTQTHSHTHTHTETYSLSLPLSLSLSLSHTHTHTRARARTHHNKHTTRALRAIAHQLARAGTQHTHTLSLRDTTQPPLSLHTHNYLSHTHLSLTHTQLALSPHTLSRSSRSHTTSLSHTLTQHTHTHTHTHTHAQNT